MNRISRRSLIKGAGAGIALVPAASALLASCSLPGGKSSKSEAGSADEEDIAKERKLTSDDLAAAAETYTPSGIHDPYYMFASGGHAGQVLVVGLPSMRILKEIGVFTPEPWQGWGFSDDAKAVLDSGKVDGNAITWGDTHHPALSETNGAYDGQFLFINDKAHARIGVIDLRDFVTKQIIKNPHIISDHAQFVTPNTEYLVEGSQYATPIGWEYAPIEQYKEKYRGAMTFWKFDRAKGRIIPEESFTIELPPYDQDLGDAGKLVSDGWAFLNSCNTEMAWGDDLNGKPSLEMGASQRDMDYLTVVNWKKAAEVVKAGKASQVKGMALISIDTAVKEGLIFEIPEPKSPHGVDVAPKGDLVVIAGKLDPHVTVYSFQKIQDTIASGKFDKDDFGIPILDFNSCLEAQVELGLGPLHTQFDDEGYAYTSLFLDSAVARWTLGGSYRKDGWKLIEKLPVNYNVGHLAAIEGDTVNPQGKFLVSLNKWAIDRFAEVGPLHPQNFQLIDISGDKMRLVYDMPIGMAEPHYAQIVRAETLKPWPTYPQSGWDPQTQSPSPNATTQHQEAVERNGTTVTVKSWVMRSRITPDLVKIKQGDKVVWHVSNPETAEDATHGLAIPAHNINLSIEPGATLTVSFNAEHAGVYPFYCTEFCSALHLEMMGYLIVEPT
ncbi:MAG TPA: Sec-dependent nitrous-oxide reductase [Nitrolancea sp.]|nr:Sec-dependent nitrous-oxide reductase [Nitrolancea sp.]